MTEVKKTESLLLNQRAQDVIRQALDRGDNVEIRRNRNGLVVYRVQKKIIYTDTDGPASNGKREEPNGVLTG